MTVAGVAPARPGQGVIVLGVDSQIGLSVVRELGERGVPVVGIGRTKEAVGLYSRYLVKGYVHGPRNDALLALIREIADTHATPFLMTVSEGDIVFLNRSREELSGLKLLIPDMAAIRQVIDKDRIYALGRRLGMRVPEAVDPNQDGADPGALRFPVVLKWPQPAEVMPLLRQAGLKFHKAEYCHEIAGLRRSLSRYDGIGRYPLVQEYAPGQGLGHMIYMHQGEPVLRFQHLREHEWPPEGGYSTQCRSLPAEAHARLMAQSVELLRAVGWDGPAMVEYRYDASTDTAVLMEINGRFWGSLPLAYHSRARFAWLLYTLKGLGRPVPQDAAEYRSGVVCRFALPETKRLIRILLQRDRIQDRSLHFSPLREIAAYLGYFLNPANRYYILSLRDPSPFLHDMGGLIKRALPKLGRRPGAEVRQ